jgi:FkbM family methyltransferase
MKMLVQAFLGIFGREIRSTNAPLQSFEKGLRALAKIIEVEQVIDIGVAEGTPELYKTFTGKQFLLIEANLAYKKNLEALSATLPAKVEMVFCGEKAGTVPFRMMGRESSALIEMYGGARKEKMVDVPVEPLDSILERAGFFGSSLIKIDVEGAEMSVLKGAARALQKAQAVILEVSLGRRYEGGTTADELVCYMKERGFFLFNILGGTVEHDRLIMADFVFVRSDII